MDLFTRESTPLGISFIIHWSCSFGFIHKIRQPNALGVEINMKPFSLYWGSVLHADINNYMYCLGCRHSRLPFWCLGQSLSPPRLVRAEARTVCEQSEGLSPPLFSQMLLFLASEDLEIMWRSGAFQNGGSVLSSFAIPLLNLQKKTKSINT